MAAGPVRLAVRVTPRAGRDEVVGWSGAELEVRVTSAPDRGRANAAVCELVAGAMGVPKSSVSVARGASSRHKLLLIEDVDADNVASAFGEPG